MAAWQLCWHRFLPTFCLSHSIQVNRVMTYRDLDSDLMKYSAFQTLVSGQLPRRGAGSHRHMQGFLSSSQVLQPLLCEALRLPGDSPFAGDILLGCESIPGLSLSQCSQGQSPPCPRLPPPGVHSPPRRAKPVGYRGVGIPPALSGRVVHLQFCCCTAVPAGLGLGSSSPLNLVPRGDCPKAPWYTNPLPPRTCSQDGEIDLKLLTKVLAPEHEVREVCGSGRSRPSAVAAGPEADLGGRLAVPEGRTSPVSPQDASLGRTTSAGTGTICTRRCPPSSSASGTRCRRTRRAPWGRLHTPEPGGCAPCMRTPPLWTRRKGHKPKMLASGSGFLCMDYFVIKIFSVVRNCIVLWQEIAFAL